MEGRVVMGLIVFAVGVAGVWTVLYVAYFRSGSTIHAATGQRQEPKPEPYTATTEVATDYLHDYLPQTRPRRASRPSQMPMRRQP